MTGIELFIVIGGCYALYTTGMAIATTVDYYATEKEEKLIKLGKHRQFNQCHTGTTKVPVILYNKDITNKV